MRGTVSNKLQTGNAMILTLSKRAMLSAMIFQAKNDVRYYLNGICFGPDKKLYSTDGHRAFVGEHETEGLTGNIIIAIKGPRFIKFDKAQIDTESEIITYQDEIGARVGFGLCSVVDGLFPNIEKIIPKENKPVSEICFNASYLADIEKAARLYNPHFEAIKIKTNGSDGAAICEFSAAFEKGAVIVMPMRI